MTEREIFTAALAKEDPDQRAAFLDEQCAGNAPLRQRIDSLLADHGQLGSFMDVPSPAATLDQSPRERPGTMIGPYKLLQQIGEGGMGVVYMAEQTEPVQRKVALKLIKPGMDSRQVIARFEAERQALAMMDHVNIARVLDGGTTGEPRTSATGGSPSPGANASGSPGRPYFVMELVHGVPITKYCDDNRLTPRQRLELFVPVCQAIQHAHQKGIIHRDIKPSNVMVTLYDGKPVPKVIDFGVAKATEQKLTERTLFTQYGTLVGTLEYMSPEQAEMSALGVDTRSDIYSLGVLLYELLTGSTPLTHKRMKEAAYAEILRLIKEEEPPKPSTRLTDSGEALASISAQRHTEPAKLSKLVRGELDWIVMKTLEKDRNRRYETANAFAADVQRYLYDEPVQACPPSAGYRLRKFARRNKAGLAMAFIVGVALLSAVGSLGWSVRDRAAREQEFARDRAARQMAVEQEVKLALKEAEQWQAQEKWSEALSAAKRAEGLLAGGGSDELREHVPQFRSDIEMVLRLEEIPLVWSELTNNMFGYEAADRAYAQAFADYGIDVAGLPVTEAAARVRVRPGIAVAVAVALDDWAFVRSQADKAGSLALTAVAQAADPDPWRQQVREAVKEKDGKSLAALAASTDFLRQPPTSLLVLARAFRDANMAEAQIKLLRQAQRQYPGNFWINYQLGAALSRIGPPFREEAVSFLRAALAVRPQSSAAHSELGFALRNQKRLDEAIAAYRKAIELDPKSAPAHSNLGITLADQGMLADATAFCRKATELDPKSARIQNNLGNALAKQKKLDEAVAAFRKAIELDPKYALAQCNLGSALADQGKPDEAIASFKKSIELDPKSANSHNTLGTALGKQMKLDEAIASFRKAIALDSKSANAHGNLGIALGKQKKLDEAIASYRKAIELDPKLAGVHDYLGLALSAQGKLDEAIACHRTAIEHDPKDAGAHNHLGIALAGVKKPDEAIACFRKAIELDGKNAHVHKNLGVVLNAQGKMGEAIASYRKAIELDPTLAGPHISLARLLANCSDVKLRDPAEALRLAKKAVELEPHSAVSWQMLGSGHYRAGAWKDSINALHKSIELQKDGGDPGQWFFLAMAHWHLGDKDEARQWYDQAALWTEKNAKQSAELERIQIEAEELLELKRKKD